MFSTMQWIESQDGMDPQCMEDKPGSVDIANRTTLEEMNEEPNPASRNCEILPCHDVDLEHSNCNPTKFVPITSTRMLGKRIEIDLIKGSDGLGFSITTRDNFSAGDAPIYIKTILPRGAAIGDGRLHPGDRLLEVNGIAMSGKSQEEATSILRSLNPGSTVNLVVSRQTIVDHLDLMVDQRTDEFCDVTELMQAVGRGQAEHVMAADGGLIKATTTVPERGQIGVIDANGVGQMRRNTHAEDRGQTEQNISKNGDLRQRDTAATDQGHAPAADQGQATAADIGQAHVANRGQALAADKFQAPAADRGQAPAADRGQAHAADRGQASAADKDQAPAADRSQASAADKDQAPAADRGQAPAADKGQIGEDTSSTDMELEQLTITIARTEHQKNGLGISIKGKTLETANETKDLGLFIWSVLPGGAAAKDGRLKPDDRLVGINGKTLFGCTNNDAMDIIRGVLHCDTCHTIELTIVRNRLAPGMFVNDSRFRVPVRNYVSFAQSCSDSVSNLTERISACEKVGCRQVLCRTVESNSMSRLIERKETVPVESYVSLPSVAENALAELRTYENSLSHRDACEVDSEAKGVVTASEQQTSDSSLQADGYLCGESRAAKDSESSSTSELDSELGPLGVFSRDGFGRQSVSEKRKACVDPRSFALYNQIKNGKRENVQNPVKRALSIESILSQKMMIHSTVSPILMVSDESLKRFNSFESMQTVTHSCLQRTANASQNQSQPDFKQISFRDAFGYCYESQLITEENVDSESSRLGRSALASERKKKKKVLRGLSSVFRFGKTKKNPIDNNACYGQTEGDARKLSEKRQKLQNNLVPSSITSERLLQMVKFQSGNTSTTSADQEHSDCDQRREQCYVLDHSAQPSSALFDRSTGICQCQINSRQVQCHHCLSGVIELDKMEESSFREFQNNDRYGIHHSNQNPPQARLFPSRQREEQCSNCSESTSIRTHPMFVSANKMRFQGELQGRQRRQKVGGKLISHNAPDPGSRRFPCCHAAGEEICFPEGYYHKLESMESVNRWNTPKLLPAENSSVSKCDTPGIASGPVQINPCKDAFPTI